MHRAIQRLVGLRALSARPLQTYSRRTFMSTHLASNIPKFDKILYTANTHTTGGRQGESKSDDGRLVVQMSPPGSPGKGTNPEQLFAAGFSACFIGAIRAVATQQGLKIPEPTVDASVDLGTGPEGYGIAARLVVTLPGMEKTAAQKLIEDAHKVCPYSKATRGNVDVLVTLKASL